MLCTNPGVACTELELPPPLSRRAASRLYSLIAAKMGAAFMKFGRAPTTVIIFIQLPRDGLKHVKDRLTKMVPCRCRLPERSSTKNDGRVSPKAESKTIWLLHLVVAAAAFSQCDQARSSQSLKV